MTSATHASAGRTAAVAVGIVATAAAGYVAYNALTTDTDPTVRATMSVEETLGGADTTGFARASAPRTFAFPADHGPHPDFRNEWWYLTGNLESADGRRFGYQLTIFRSALAPAAPDRRSEWATRQAWMAHFALSDAGSSRFHASERFARGSLGLAGARPDPFRVWLEDWSVESIESDAFFPLRVRATIDSAAIDLVLDAGKPIALNGNAGLSRKGPEPGNASYYYSFTRLPSSGTMTTAAGSWTVNGTSWIDREWSTSALSPGVAGWDWFAIQLDDATDIMLYRLRREDGSADPFSAGTFVAPDGSATHLEASDFEIRSTDAWTSPVDDTTWPVRWTIEIPDRQLRLDIVPLFPNQEHTGSFRYWEGAVDVAGTSARSPITGRGYVELTGYSTSPPSPGR